MAILRLQLPKFIRLVFLALHLDVTDFDDSFPSSTILRTNFIYCGHCKNDAYHNFGIYDILLIIKV